MSVTSITITVDDETAEALRRLAALEQRSEADIVRTALAAYTQAQPRAKGIGKYHSGRSDLSVKARELIRQDVKDGRWPYLRHGRRVGPLRRPHSSCVDKGCRRTRTGPVEGRAELRGTLSNEHRGQTHENR